MSQGLYGGSRRAYLRGAVRSSARDSELCLAGSRSTRGHGRTSLYPRHAHSCGVIVGQVAHGATFDEILEGYPDLERDDIREALEYAAWLTRDRNPTSWRAEVGTEGNQRSGS